MFSCFNTPVSNSLVIIRLLLTLKTFWEGKSVSWIRHFGAGKHLKHPGQSASKSRVLKNTIFKNMHFNCLLKRSVILIVKFSSFIICIHQFTDKIILFTACVLPMTPPTQTVLCNIINVYFFYVYTVQVSQNVKQQLDSLNKCA